MFREQKTLLTIWEDDNFEALIIYMEIEAWELTWRGKMVGTQKPKGSKETQFQFWFWFACKGPTGLETI